jgi:hypothetical protein
MSISPSIMHGTPAGRFPLMELTHLPLIFDSGEQASRVLMNLVPEYLAAEHRGVRILYLFGHAPGHIHSRTRAVRTPADLRGLRIRHPSAVLGETLRAWGASPAGMPPGEMVGNLTKGVIDGLMMPYDGVIAFRVGPHVRYTTEVFSYVTSFAVVMNPDSYARLPPDLQALIDETTGPEAARTVARGGTRPSHGPAVHGGERGRDRRAEPRRTHGVHGCIGGICREPARGRRSAGAARARLPGAGAGAGRSLLTGRFGR